MGARGGLHTPPGNMGAQHGGRRCTPRAQSLSPPPEKLHSQVAGAPGPWGLRTVPGRRHQAHHWTQPRVRPFPPRCLGPLCSSPVTVNQGSRCLTGQSRGGRWGDREAGRAVAGLGPQELCGADPGTVPCQPMLTPRLDRSTHSQAGVGVVPRNHRSTHVSATVARVCYATRCGCGTLAPSRAAGCNRAQPSPCNSPPCPPLPPSRSLRGNCRDMCTDTPPWGGRGMVTPQRHPLGADPGKEVVVSHF